MKELTSSSPNKDLDEAWDPSPSIMSTKFQIMRGSALLVVCFVAFYEVINSWSRCQRLESGSPIVIHVDRRKEQAYPITNIALLGQFNYDVPKDRVENWVHIWSKYFSTISVVGPFSNNTYDSLRQAGFDIHFGANDKGYASPVENVVKALQRAPVGIDAVLYVHDDGLLNLTKFAHGRSQIPVDRFIGNLQHVPDRTYSITIPTDPSKQVIYDIPGHNNTPTSNKALFLQSLPYWYFHEFCTEHQLKMLLRNNSDLQAFATSRTEEGLQFFFAGHGQMDFLMVPMIHKDMFIRIAQLFIQDEVFLECAIPSIVLWLLQEEQRQKNAIKEEYFSSSILLKQETSYIPICTSWNEGGRNARGSREMLENCLAQPNHQYGMYHPVKLSVYNASEYAQWLDRVQQPAKEFTLSGHF